MKEYICCYCLGHIFQADVESDPEAECPKCGKKLPVEALRNWKDRVGKKPQQVFDNVTTEGDSQ